MPANVFDVFMSNHPPVGELVDQANEVLWDRGALNPVVKERMRIALAEAIGCSYCARFRTADGGEAILEREVGLPPAERGKAELAERFAVAAYRGDGEALDDLTVAVQEYFSPQEFSDLVFSIGWFIGMQHVGRLMHWDQACPVAPIRQLVEAGEAA